MKLKSRIYRFKRVIKEILYLYNNFHNWDVIIKRAIDGKLTNIYYLKNGLKIHSNNINTLSIFREIFINKVYLKDGVVIEEGDIVFDIGANIGIFSLFASLTKDVKVYSFEPHTQNFETLDLNIKSNGISNVEIFNFAVGSENDDRYLIEGEDPGNHKVVNKKINMPISNFLKVKGVTIDTFISDLKIKKIDFLKLDCEGSEGEIIKSLNKHSLNKINKIAIEFHDKLSVLNHDEILTHLEEAGFKTSLDWDDKTTYGYIYAKNTQFQNIHK